MPVGQRVGQGVGAQHPLALAKPYEKLDDAFARLIIREK